MLPRENRLKKEKEIKRVLASKLGGKCGPLICKTAATKSEAVRFCFVVSKKVSNKAVVRNKTKRRLREAVKLVLPQIKKGADCILIALPGLEAMPYSEVAECARRTLWKCGLLKNSKSNDKL